MLRKQRNSANQTLILKSRPEPWYSMSGKQIPLKSQHWELSPLNALYSPGTTPSGHLDSPPVNQHPVASGVGLLAHPVSATCPPDRRHVSGPSHIWQQQHSRPEARSGERQLMSGCPAKQPEVLQPQPRLSLQPLHCAQLHCLPTLPPPPRYGEPRIRAQQLEYSDPGEPTPGLGRTLTFPGPSQNWFSSVGDLPAEGEVPTALGNNRGLGSKAMVDGQPTQGGNEVACLGSPLVALVGGLP